MRTAYYLYYFRTLSMSKFVLELQNEQDYDVLSVLPWNKD